MDTVKKKTRSLKLKLWDVFHPFNDVDEWRYLGQPAARTRYNDLPLPQVFHGRERNIPVDTKRASGVGQDHGDGSHSETLSPVESGHGGGGGEIRQRVRVQFVAGANAQLTGHTIESCG